MSWLLTFWLIAGDGTVFAHDTLHGFATEADCRDFGAHIPVRHGEVRWTCAKETSVRPSVWFTDRNF